MACPFRAWTLTTGYQALGHGWRVDDTVDRVHLCGRVPVTIISSLCPLPHAASLQQETFTSTSLHAWSHIVYSAQVLAWLVLAYLVASELLSPTASFVVALCAHVIIAILFGATGGGTQKGSQTEARRRCSGIGHAVCDARRALFCWNLFRWIPQGISQNTMSPWILSPRYHIWLPWLCWKYLLQSADSF